MKSMKYFSGAAMTAALMLSLASCSSDELANGSASSSSKALSQVPLEITVNDAESRSIIEGTTLPEECSYQIYPYIINSDGSYKSLLYDGNTDDEGITVNYVKGNSNLTRSVYLPEDGSNVNVVGLYGTKGFYYYDFVNKVRLSVQDQEDYLVGHNVNVVNKNNPKAQMSFQHLMSRVTLRITKSEDNDNIYKISEVEVNNLASSGLMLFTPEGKIDFEQYYNTTTTSIVAGCKDNYVLDSPKDEILFDFLVLPTEQEGIEVTLFGVGSNNQKVTLPTVDFKSGEQYTFNIVIGKTTPILVEEHEAVDLGLPSGVKWATCNVDLSQPNKAATAPEAYGGYYAWADPTGESTSNNPSDFPAAVPPASICGTEYDIAYVNWGKAWRLPTIDEQEELREKCSWYQIQIDGKPCYKVVGPNGKYIIIPLAGCYARYNGTFTLNRGYYWSGTSYAYEHYTGNPYGGWLTDMQWVKESSQPTNSYIDSHVVMERYSRMSVRPVTDQ